MKKFNSKNQRKIRLLKAVAVLFVAFFAMPIITAGTSNLSAQASANGTATAQIFNIDDVANLQIETSGVAAIEVRVLGSINDIRILNSQALIFR